MSAIENCRTAPRRAGSAPLARRGHIERCENSACGHMAVAYNSCMNRHCPKCQGAAARERLAAREAELLPVQYFHQVFTLPGAIADIAYQNKAVIYDLLFKASAEAMLTIGADPKHLVPGSASSPCCTRAHSGEVVRGSPPGVRAYYKPGARFQRALGDRR